MTPSARLKQDGRRIYQGSLLTTLEPDLSCHYGTHVDGVEPGDTLTIEIETPPQVSRHDGFETAFPDDSADSSMPIARAGILVDLKPLIQGHDLS